MTIALAFLLLSPYLSGQSLTPPRNLTGRVTDRQHEPLRGAIVEIHSEDTGTTVSYITGKDGLYSFKRLFGNLDYSVWATYRGQKSRVKKVSGFDTHANTVVDLKIILK